MFRRCPQCGALNKSTVADTVVAQSVSPNSGKPAWGDVVVVDGLWRNISFTFVAISFSSLWCFKPNSERSRTGLDYYNGLLHFIHSTREKKCCMCGFIIFLDDRDNIFLRISEVPRQRYMQYSNIITPITTYDKTSIRSCCHMAVCYICAPTPSPKKAFQC